MKYTRESLQELTRSELRRICNEFNIKSARTNAQTIQRILSVTQPVQTINYQPLNTNNTISNSTENLLENAEQNRIRIYFWKIIKTVRNMRKVDLLPYYIILILSLYYNCGSWNSNPYLADSSDAKFDGCQQLYSQCKGFVNDFIASNKHQETPSISYVLDNLGYTTECPNNVEALNNMIHSNRKILGVLFVGIGLLGMLLLQLLGKKQSDFNSISN